MSETPTIESLASRLEDLKHFHINTLDTIDTWLGGFSILIAIATIGLLIYVNKRDDEIKRLQEKGIEDAKKEILEKLEQDQKSQDAQSKTSDVDNVDLEGV